MKILIIEDEVRLAEAIRRGLARRGYTSDVLLDGEKALERILLYHEDYDLVILDLMIPGLSGYEVCKQVRAREIGTPILVLSARDEVETKVELLNIGADDYLAKPFSFKELDARIQAIIRRPAEGGASVVLRARGLVLNPIERTVTRGEVPIILTLKEFALLEYFMRNPNRVINREELLNHLWDFNYTSFNSNVLDVHIKNLRKKIDYADTPSIIETVRGIGYKFNQEAA